MFGIFIGKGGEPTAGGGLALVANMGMGGPYLVEKSSASNPTTATIRLTVLRDGTWSIGGVTGQGTLTSGTPSSGSWGSPNQAFAGDDYEVSFDNGTSYTRLNTNRNFDVGVDDTTANDGAATGGSTITVIVRKIGTTSPTSSDTVTLNVSANYTTV